MTKQDLKDYQRMNIELKRLEDKKAELRNKAVSLKSSIISDMPKGGERKNFTDYLDELVELQDFYDMRAKEITKKQNRIEHIISLLDDPIERAILSYRYTDDIPFEEICVKINYSWRQTHRIHSNALKNIAII